jgi:histone acetyltransferase (RNA polymerase elongator complex component)
MQGKHVIIPVFVPHKGCPHNCIFCNQKKISGQMDERGPEKVSQIIEEHLATIRPGSFVELAFYCGSFTAIDFNLQRKFLEVASPYLNSGKISEIRLSTRPDYIDDKILALLKQYGVRTIELGVQSLDDEVLRASCRGHDAACVYEAAALIRERGFRLGIQTMTGLPGDTREKCLDTARKVISISPEIVRIYPVLVIRGTALEELYRSGRYAPQQLDEAVGLCAELLDLYEAHGIQVIRIGLQITENINDSEKSEVAAGPIHPALRQLVESRRMLCHMEREIKKQGITGAKSLTITAGASNLSNVIGQKRCNVEYLSEKYGIGNIRVKVDPSFEREIVLTRN